MEVEIANLLWSFHFSSPPDRLAWVTWVSGRVPVDNQSLLRCELMPRSERALINKESSCGLKTTVCPTMEERTYTKENQTNVPLAPEGWIPKVFVTIKLAIQCVGLWANCFVTVLAIHVVVAQVVLSNSNHCTMVDQDTKEFELQVERVFWFPECSVLFGNVKCSQK